MTLILRVYALCVLELKLFLTNEDTLKQSIPTEGTVYIQFHNWAEQTALTKMLSLAEFKPSAGRIFVKPPPDEILRLSRI